MTTRPRERQLRVGGRRPREAVGSWTGEQRGKQQNESCSRRPREAVGSWTGDQESELRLETTEGQSTPDTRAERRGDKIGSSEEESQDV